MTANAALRRVNCACQICWPSDGVTALVNTGRATNIICLLPYKAPDIVLCDIPVSCHLFLWLQCGVMQDTSRQQNAKPFFVRKVLHVSADFGSGAYLGLYKQQESLLVCTLCPFIKILILGSMYSTAA